MRVAFEFRKFIDNLKKWRWSMQNERDLRTLAGERFINKTTLQSSQNASGNLMFVCEEFFHPDIRGFGGFGKTVKNIAEYFNYKPVSGLAVTLALPQPSPLVQYPEIRRYHGTDVVFRPSEDGIKSHVFHQYGDLLSKFRPRIIITIDWYPSYSRPVYALSSIPLLVWIHDPRDRAEWEKIAGVADEMRFRGMTSPEGLVALADEKRVSIKRLFSLQGLLPRRIVFATTAQSLVPRAERTYGIGGIAAHWLPNPIEIPFVESIEYSVKPSLLYLGRLDAVKRPWIAFELAKRHPEIDFLIAGQAHVPMLMDPWIQRYRDLQNLKFLGHVDGEAKDALLRSCWGVINTSVHEAEPVSFLETFSYGKCVIGCHDPDNEVTKFGYFTGEVLGEGLDEEALGRFSLQIQKLVSNKQDRYEKGCRAREEMLNNHTFESFQKHLQLILEAEGI